MWRTNNKTRRRNPENLKNSPANWIKIHTKGTSVLCLNLPVARWGSLVQGEVHRPVQQNPTKKGKKKCSHTADCLSPLQNLLASVKYKRDFFVTQFSTLPPPTHTHTPSKTKVMSLPEGPVGFVFRQGTKLAMYGILNVFYVVIRVALPRRNSPLKLEGPLEKCRCVNCDVAKKEKMRTSKSKLNVICDRQLR